MTTLNEREGIIHLEVSERCNDSSPIRLPMTSPKEPLFLDPASASISTRIHHQPNLSPYHLVTFKCTSKIPIHLHFPSFFLPSFSFRVLRTAVERVLWCLISQGSSSSRGFRNRICTTFRLLIRFPCGLISSAIVIGDAIIFLAKILFMIKISKFTIIETCI